MAKKGRMPAGLKRYWASKRASRTRVKTRVVTRYSQVRAHAHSARRRYSSSRFSGTIGKPKDFAVGVLGNFLLNRYSPFLKTSPYREDVNHIILGAALPMVGFNNRDYLSVGIKDGLTHLANAYLAPQLTQYGL